MRILIAGSSGLIGRPTSAALRSDGHEVIRLVRRPAEADDELSWSPATGELPLAECRKADAVINLCGADLAATRWTEGRRAQLRTSRIDATQTLAKIFIGAAAEGAKAPGLFISASAIGIYGDRGNLELPESSGPGNGFLADLCRDWEGAAMAAAESGARVVCTRFGIILSGEGAMLRRVAPFYRAGLGCQLGNGRQWMSWIGLEDVVGVLRFSVVQQGVSGAINVVSPNAVTNAAFTRAMKRIFGKQLPMPVPPLMLRIMYGRVADEALLASAHVVPYKLFKAGYPFRYPNLEDALYQALALEKHEG